MNRLLIVLLILLTVVFTGCGAQKVYMCSDGTIGGGQDITNNNVIYICPDGREAASPTTCRFELPFVIEKKDAEQKAFSFVQGHVQANGWQTKLVNVYPEGNIYQAQLIISKFNEDSYETTIEINGTTGAVACAQNCEYIS
ncbi:hypothetical protein K9M74_04925 [Candidatus Woesearchaeota archaeon]|nr:hypothetical protein [Candidatus Woesearchaeota archaeon]